MTVVKCIVRIWIVFCIVFTQTLPMNASAEGSVADDDITGGKAYVLYDLSSRYGSAYPMIIALEEHLGHFELDCEHDSFDNWDAEKVQDADVVVVVGLQDTQMSPALLEALSKAKRVVWFERNIEQLAAWLHWDDFSIAGPEHGWTYTEQGGKKHFLPEWMDVIMTNPGNAGNILAYAKNATTTKPLAWQRGNVSYCGLLEPESVFMVTLGRILHRFIPNKHVHSRQVLLRVEDVSPLVDPKAVQKVVETISQYGIPFAIGVIPIGRDPDGRDIAMHENPEMVKVLKDAQANGASIIMHGYTHQNEFSPKTGEGYEFWNARDDSPMDDAYNFTSNRLEAGITELMRCELVPVAFETPHYAISSEAYRALSKYFNIYSGQIQISDSTEEDSTTTPYETKSPHLYGMRVIPENMGYYEQDENSIRDMLRSAQDVSDEDDAFAGFFYHGYLPPDRLPELIEGLQKQDYTFFNLHQQKIRVRSSQISIDGDHGDFRITIAPELKEQWGNEPVKGNLGEKIGAVHISLLLVLICAMLGVIVRLRMNERKKYERDVPVHNKKSE